VYIYNRTLSFAYQTLYLTYEMISQHVTQGSCFLCEFMIESFDS